MSLGTSGTFYPWGPFGSFFWGGFWAPPPGVNIGVSNIANETTLTAEPIDYSTIALKWQQPQENFDIYVIVRNTTGYPLTLTEGIVVQFGNKNDNITSMDDGSLSAGFYYYSLFVRIASATPQWVRVGQAFALVPTANESGGWLFELLPEWYQTLDEQTPGHPTNMMMAEWGQLRRFFEMLGLEYDNLRSESASLLEAYDPRFVRADLLQYFSNMFGFPYEPNIGYARMRALMSNWFEILKTKGTANAINLFVESMSGYEAQTAIGINLLLTPNDSEGVETVGFWRQDPSGRLAATNGTPVLTPITPLALYTATCTTAIKALTDATHALALIDGDSSSATSVRLTGIPVVGGLTYDYQVAFRAIDAVTGIPQLALYWYNASGVYISDNIVTGSAYNNAAWTVSSMTIAAPANAAYVLPAFTTNPGANKNIEFTGVMVNVGAGVPAYEPARQIHIDMNPTRINYFPNPSFEGSGANLYFTPTAGFTLTKSSERSNPAVGGANSMKIALTPGTTNVMVSSAFVTPTAIVGRIPIPSFVQGDVWSFVMTIYPAQTPQNEIVYPFIETYFKDSSTQIKTANITAPNLGLGWAQMFVDVEVIGDQTTQDPWFTLGIAITNAPNTGPAYYIDAVQLERNAFIYQYSYFDGNSDHTSEDFVWSGDINNSASMYFPNRFVRSGRLDALLPQYVPPLCTFTTDFVLPST